MVSWNGRYTTPLNDTSRDTHTKTYLDLVTVNFFLPFARRRESTRRPVEVPARFKKP